MGGADSGSPQITGFVLLRAQQVQSSPIETNPVIPAAPHVDAWQGAEHSERF